MEIELQSEVQIGEAHNLLKEKRKQMEKSGQLESASSSLLAIFGPIFPMFAQNKK